MGLKTWRNLKIQGMNLLRQHRVRRKITVKENRHLLPSLIFGIMSGNWCCEGLVQGQNSVVGTKLVSKT